MTHWYGMLSNRDNLPLKISGIAIFLFCVVFFCLPAWAAEQTPGASDREPTSIIVYLHPVATEVEITVDELPVFKTGLVFGVWCYQFNLTSLLDTKPRTVEVKIHLGNNESAYCDIEVRKIEGNPAKTTILAQKSIKAANLSSWNKKQTALQIDIALPEGSVHPLWSEVNTVGLKPVMRDTSIELVKELFAAIQKCDINALMPLIDPALTNQAMMEGIPVDLFKQTMRKKLMRYCVPDIAVAETMDAFYEGTYTDRMAPLDFDKMYYSFMKDPGREDKKGNVYSPVEPIRFFNKSNHQFVVRIFFSYADERREKRYVSRFLFERIE